LNDTPLGTSRRAAEQQSAELALAALRKK